MQLFGSNFLRIRNTNIIPLVGYGITRKKYEFWSLKEVLTTRLISLVKLQGKSIEIEIGKEDFYKALHCDIELFMNKSFVQYADFAKSIKNSPTWSFVTLYYFAFFVTTCFFRFQRKGFVFLSGEQKGNLERFSLAMYSTPIQLESGNYYFSFKEENLLGNIVLILTFKGESVHKQSWNQLVSTLQESIPFCDSDERAIYDLFLRLFSNFKTEFPSNLRNTLNYNGDSSILDLENSIPYIDLKSINTDFIKGLFNLNSEPNHKNKIDCVAYLSLFLFKFNSELYSEYAKRSGFGIDFHRERMKYLREHRITNVH